jgi:[ribosomal protein S18]-alanine N-acetyltransferase
VAAGLTIEPLGQRHLRRLLVIERICFAQPWGDADFRCVLSDASAICRGAHLGGLLVAFAIGYREETILHLASLAVDPGYRRRGYATALLHHALGEARQSGARECDLEVRESNEPARSLYQNRGFRCVGRQSGFYRGPIEDALMLKASL